MSQILDFHGTFVLDTCGVPETAVGAMENWGLIIYHEDRIFYTKEDNPASSLIASADTIAHEIAHQVKSQISFQTTDISKKLLRPRLLVPQI